MRTSYENINKKLIDSSADFNSEFCLMALVVYRPFVEVSIIVVDNKRIVVTSAFVTCDLL